MNQHGWRLAFVLALAMAPARAGAEHVIEFLDGRAEHFGRIASQIFDFAELGYLEEKSSRLLQQELHDAGFAVEAGVADIPTAFVATYGQGRPIVGILAEFDALPGLSQQPRPERAPVEEGAAGHACGHHLFGTASTAAAIAVADWLSAADVPGTVRLYGTPAEEGGSAKVYMTRAGVFDRADVVLHWHPADRNRAMAGPTLANKSAKFRSRGRPSHAAAAPERGLSALDGVEAMNHMVNLLREHVPDQSRIHYVITRGGEAPNVVPEHAEVFYYVRHPSPETLEEIFARVRDAAEGAALGTGTEVAHEVIHGNHSLLPNATLAELLDANLRRVGGVTYDRGERRFAEKLRKTLDRVDRPLESAAEIEELDTSLRMGSTDVGDVSWNTPSGGFGAATWVPGTPPHTWQAVAAGGMSIGAKGMLVAAKVLALTALDLIRDRDLVAAARAEFEERRAGLRYAPILGDRDPPLDYRK